VAGRQDQGWGCRAGGRTRASGWVLFEVADRDTGAALAAELDDVWDIAYPLKTNAVSGCAAFAEEVYLKL
jgi:hypothetical protein